MAIKRSVSSRAFDIVNVIVLALCSCLTILPFIYCAAASLATEQEIATRPLFFFPHQVSFDAYTYILGSSTILRAAKNSLFVTVVGTAINMFMTLTMAYPLSKRHLHGRTFFLNVVIFTMFFGGGMIPTYLLVSNLGMLNTWWSVLIPGAISTYNMMIVKNFFQEIPAELEESARLDGCTDIGALWYIVLPLSLPVIATFSLFYAVGHWNAWFDSMIYMQRAQKKWPLQVILRQIILLSEMSAGEMSEMNPDFVEPPQQSVKMAVIVVSTVPIMMVYPFLQKYFAKGVMVGALKG